MKTYSVSAKEIVPQWHVIDATDQPLGRLATRVASLLRGKHRANFTPNLDMRDFVVVVNAAKVRFTGKNKMQQKTYYHHTQYPGGLKAVTLEKMMATHPQRVIEHAVRGMLPHNRLGAKLRGHLKVYVGAEHPHGAQIKTAAMAERVRVPLPKPEPVKPEVEEAVSVAPPEEVEAEAEEEAAEVVAEAEAAPEADAEASPEVEETSEEEES
jgi:large subunit ribosomal protein L13